MTPCGRCANCRNGAPGLCLAHYSGLLAVTKGVPRDYCECGKPLYERDRLCRIAGSPIGDGRNATISDVADVDSLRKKALCLLGEKGLIWQGVVLWYLERPGRAVAQRRAHE